MAENSDLSLIEQAQKAAERLEAANRVMEDLVKRQEAAEARMEARRILGGQSQAGGAKQAEMTPEQKIQEDMKLFYKGSAIEKAFK